MPRGHLTKEYFKVLILQQKIKLEKEPYYSSDPKSVANRYLNELLDKLEEFRY